MEEEQKGVGESILRNISLVVNTNVLFSFFGKSSTTRELIFLLSGNLIGPEFAIEELKEHREEVIKKARITDEDFGKIISILRKHVVFVEEDFYAEFIPLALKISPDPDDADFVALALKTGFPLWSNDKKLKSVRDIIVLSTNDLLHQL